MNERLKQLAIDSGIHFDPTRSNRIHFVNTETLEKFAKAIVTECSFVGMVITDDHFSSDDLFDHFGMNK